MKIQFYILSVLTIIIFSFDLSLPPKKNIPITWTNEIKGDFSFINKWNYEEGIYWNKFGQLSCDGFCPERAYNMKDKEGKILKDSLKSFYQIIDTTHRFHSIKSDVSMYEYAGCNFIEVKRINKDTIRCFTYNNAATHSSLSIEIVNNTYTAEVDFNSITTIDRHTFFCKKGEITIDSNEWNRGILKAKFDFIFHNDLNYKDSLSWKGLLYKKIETN